MSEIREGIIKVCNRSFNPVVSRKIGYYSATKNKPERDKVNWVKIREDQIDWAFKNLNKQVKYIIELPEYDDEWAVIQDI